MTMTKYLHRAKLFAQLVGRHNLAGAARMDVRLSWRIACIAYR